MTWFRAIVKKCDQTSGRLSIRCVAHLTVSRLRASSSTHSPTRLPTPNALCAGQATLYYRGTQEKEQGELFSLIRDGQVAFKESRPGPKYEPTEGEVLVTADVKIDECEGEPGNSDSGESEGSEDVGDGEEDELSLSRRKRRLNARRVYETYLDEGMLDGSDDDYEMDTPLKTARRAKLGESKTEAVRELARAKKQKDALRREAERKARAKGKGGLDTSAEGDIRSKVRGYIEKALQAPTKGLPEGKQADPEGVAKMVERALYRAHGDEVTQAYKQKASTLKFNLGGNEELRLHVLAGDIPPERLVEMDSTALASKELQEFRKKKEEEALKMAVLDTETAAKFSTAAALESAYSGYTGVKEANNLLANATAGTLQNVQRNGDGTSHYTKETGGKVEEEEPVDTLGSVKSMSGLDWKSIKSAQASKGEASNVISGLQMIDTGVGLDGSDGGHAAGVDTEYDPLELPSTSFKEAECDEKLRMMLMGNADSSSLGENVWQGTVSVASKGASMMRASAFAGAGDLGQLLGDDPLKFKERLSLSSLGKFFEELHKSRSKTVTVGLLSPALGKPTSTSLVDSSELASFYKGRDRAGSFKRTPDIEIYIIPAGELATRLINTCWHTGNRQTVQACLGNPPLEVTPQQLVVAVTHPKNMIAQPKPKAVVVPPPAVVAPPPAVVVPPPAVALPVGLDLGAISNLAAAFGVAEGVSKNPSRPMNAPVAPMAAPIAPVTLDLGALNSLAAAFGVSTSPSPPENPGVYRGGMDDRDAKRSRSDRSDNQYGRQR